LIDIGIYGVPMGGLPQSNGSSFSFESFLGPTNIAMAKNARAIRNPTINIAKIGTYTLCTLIECYFLLSGLRTKKKQILWGEG
jgi:hypothetical protein